jgi:beta-lactamase regulating signal transducer with metallopeptidase domain
MYPVVQSAALFLLAWIVLVAVGSLLAALIVRGVGSRLNTWDPRARHRALVLLSSLPLLAAGALMLSATLPSIVSLELPGFDHCATHNDGHPHLCFVHLPTTRMSAAFVSLLGVIVSYAFLRAGFASARVARALRVLGALAMSGESRRDLGVTIIETSQPLCVAAGLLRPRVLLSRGLLESLTPDERAVVLAHERAHVRRRDALVASVVRVLATLHVPSVSRWLVRETDVAAEQASDEEAAQFVGDRLAVASAILAVERAAQHAAAEQLAPVAVAFGQRAAERRIESLLAEPRRPRSLVILVAGFGVVASGVLAVSSELHHLIESLLSFIAY